MHSPMPSVALSPVVPCPNTLLLLSPHLVLLQLPHTLGQPSPAHPLLSATNLMSLNSVPILCLEHCHMPATMPNTPSLTRGGFTHPKFGIPGLEDVLKRGKRPLSCLAAAELLHQCLLLQK